MIINGSIIIECFDQGDNKIYEITKNLRANDINWERVARIRVLLVDELGQVIKYVEFSELDPFDISKFVFQAIIDAITFIIFVDNEMIYEVIECVKKRCENYTKLPEREED